MKQLLSKLETLVDEVIGLVREERARRNLDALKAIPTTVNQAPWPPAPFPIGQDISWQRLEVTCAPPPFMGSTVTICELQPNAALYGSH